MAVVVVPLLDGYPGGRGSSGDYRPVGSVGDLWRVIVVESNKLWAIAAPICLNILCLAGLSSTAQIFIGHIGALQLSASTIGLSVIGGFTFGLLLGMGSALETLCGQAFGAGQVHLLGVYLQRSWIILTGTVIIMSPLYIFATPILRLLGQEEQIAQLAGEFTLAILPSSLALAINFPTQKFLQAQSKVGVMAWIGLGGLILHVFLLWLFIVFFKWGMYGAAAAYDISNWVIAIAQVVYVVIWCRDGWKGLSWLAFKDIWGFLRLSCASAIMLCLEIWYMTVLVLLTGNLSNAEIAVAAISICTNINGMEGIVFVGVNAAISVRVSNELGAGHPRATKYSVINVVVQSLLIGLFFMSLILITKDHFGVIFTSSLELQKAVAHLASLLGFTMVLNSVQTVISGVAIGGGWQGLVAYVNLGCYYIIGLPFGYILGYKFNLGAEGIWAGMLFGTSLQTLILLGIIWKTNWTKEASQASERVKQWGVHYNDEAETRAIIN